MHLFQRIILNQLILLEDKNISQIKSNFSKLKIKPERPSPSATFINQKHIRLERIKIFGL